MMQRKPFRSSSTCNLLMIACLLVNISVGVFAVDADKNDNCAHWANVGECDKNPGFMHKQCAASCDRVTKQQQMDDQQLQGISSFFDLSVKDIHGSAIDFSDYRGHVTVIVNVASQCGYTDSHYKQLVELWDNHLQTFTGTPIHLLAVPCNQFGSQEPGGPKEIMDFVTTHYGVTFTMLEKMNVNGSDAAVMYKYLKKEAGPSHIAWNFATYYIIGPDGTVEAHNGVEPLSLKDRIVELASGVSEEL